MSCFEFDGGFLWLSEKTSINFSTIDGLICNNTNSKLPKSMCRITIGYWSDKMAWISIGTNPFKRYDPGKFPLPDVEEFCAKTITENMAKQ